MEKKGRTVDEAIEAALGQLGAKREDVDVVVVEEPSRGILGLLGARGATVHVRLKVDKVQRAREFLENVVAKMRAGARVEVERGGARVALNLRGPNLGVLIGRRGQTLDALQCLVNVAANRGGGERCQIIVDAEGYRSRREESLQRLARRAATRVKMSGQRVVLEPMSAHERRVIHLALQGDLGVSTHSEGQEPFRKVVVSPRR